MRLLAVGAARLVRGYQRLVSPFLPRACRFAPNCSEYARQALLLHGLVRGSWLAARRLLRCHPLNPGGYDPPPPAPHGGATRDTSRTWKNERSWPPS